MHAAEYAAHDALGLAELVRRREVCAAELLQTAIAQIERFDPRLNAVIDRLDDRARGAVAGGLPDGPFAGVPLLLKDAIAYRGARLTIGSRSMRDYVPDTSHEVVRRLEAAGLVIVGRTNICEYGLLPLTEPALYGPTRNPWDLARSPGGSSGGSAAAVAAGLVPLAHGNDGGGSIRIPASACGLFGLKPSRGRNPGSLLDEPHGLIAEHCLSRSVRDSAALLDVTRGARPGDRWRAPAPDRPYLERVAVDPPALRIAFCTSDFLGRPAHPACVAAVQDAARLCEQLGHFVEPAAPAIDGAAFNDAFAVHWTMLAGAFVKMVRREVGRAPLARGVARLLGERAAVDLATGLWTLKEGQALWEPFTRRLARLERRLTPADAWLAWTELTRADYALARFFERFDLLLTPVLGEPPWPIGALPSRASTEALRERLFRYAGFTTICNTTGVPAMSVPLYWHEGLPIGVQFIGPAFAEGTLFALAGQLERARPWWSRRPPLAVGREEGEGG